ncbi:MAG TPA: DHA2 family efflux MFS transporter permease subunit [Caulobacteraceae bacterium]|nr:DHA2 family efflux MFS transporter permease subunit [Caulobacteraceae bacterium]
MSDHRPEDEFAPMQGAPLWIAGFLLALANFMVVLDITIANVAVPNIAGGLAVSPDQGTWVITSYSVAEAITVPLTGWLAQRFGAVKVFCTAMVSFGACSALCGLAPSLGVLVVFRVLQGLSGGPMMPLSQTLMRRIFPAHQQGTALGLWGMTTVVGPIVGPLLGGVLVDGPGWPWVFYINVAPALICAWFAWRILKTRETATERKPVDIFGLALLILWVGCMQIMLDKGKDLDWFDSRFIVALAILAALGFLAFINWELTDPNPIVDLRVFRHRGFAASTAIMCVVYGAFFSSVVLIPLWLQTSLGYTATWAGRVTAWQGLFAVILSPIVGRLVTRVDSRALVCFGVTIMAGVSFWRSGFVSNVGYWNIASPHVLLGVAVPFFFIPLTGLALSSVKPQETASAAGLLNFARTVSGAFAVSITTTAWENTAAAHHADLAGNLNDPNATLNSLRSMGLSAQQAVAGLDNLVQGQAVMISTDHIFLISGLMFLFGACVVWLAPRPRTQVAAGAGGH